MNENRQQIIDKLEESSMNIADLNEIIQSGTKSKKFTGTADTIDLKKRDNSNR